MDGLHYCTVICSTAQYSSSVVLSVVATNYGAVAAATLCCRVNYSSRDGYKYPTFVQNTPQYKAPDLYTCEACDIRCLLRAAGLLLQQIKSSHVWTVSLGQLNRGTSSALHGRWHWNRGASVPERNNNQVSRGQLGMTKGYTTPLLVSFLPPPCSGNAAAKMPKLLPLGFSR